MTNTDDFNNVYLNLEIRKSEGKTDGFGNYIFEVEASNENLDLQNQIVLQNALMESKDEFLKGGVISYDHLHKRKDENGNTVVDDSMVIGEPIDVTFDEDSKKTIVKGKLYATNERAQEIIKMLKAGSTRVRASVGGIFPKIVKNAQTGIEKISHVLWNDLALTTMPVNNTVGYATFAKSMTSAEFVNALPDELKKSLCAGYNTDSATKTGGQALIPEDTTTKSQDITDEKAISEATEKMLALLKNRRISGEQEAVEYLAEQGIDKETSRQIVREIINQGGQMMKKSFSNSVASLLKSLTGGNPNDDDDDINKGTDANGGDGDDDDDIDTDGSDGAGEGDGEGDDDDDDDDDKDGGEGGDVSGEEVLKALDADLVALHKSNAKTQKQIADLGGAVEALAKMVYAIGNQQIPPQSVLNKSVVAGNGRAAGNAPAQNGRPTEDDLYRVQCVLQKAVERGEIDMIKSSMISSDMQKCMHTGKPMNPEYFKFLQRELAKEDK